MAILQKYVVRVLKTFEEIIPAGRLGKRNNRDAQPLDFRGHLVVLLLNNT